MALNYYKNVLKENAQLLASKGKGILAVDESTKTVGKRLAGIGVENTEENRKAYRGMLFTTEGLGKYISEQSSSKKLFIRITKMVSQWLRN